MPNEKAIKDHLYLDESSCPSTPFPLFKVWFKEAEDSGKFSNPSAMTLCTASKDGIPSARVVLLKNYSEEGFGFFTNIRSAKAKDLAENPNAALVFYWQHFERQVRITGEVKKLSIFKAIEYFATRPRGSQIGAWASPQSTTIANREALENKYQLWKKKLTMVSIPKPMEWGGYLIVPKQIEFWQGREFRLHDRILYSKNTNGWQIERLAP